MASVGGKPRASPEGLGGATSNAASNGEPLTLRTVGNGCVL